MGRHKPVTDVLPASLLTFFFTPFDYDPEYCVQKSFHLLVRGTDDGIRHRLLLARYLQKPPLHHKGNIGYEHRILLGEADAFGSLPMLPEAIAVCCDSCGEEFSYKQKEIMRDQVQVPENFVPHPLFKLR